MKEVFVFYVASVSTQSARTAARLLRDKEAVSGGVHVHGRARRQTPIPAAAVCCCKKDAQMRAGLRRGRAETQPRLHLRDVCVGENTSSRRDGNPRTRAVCLSAGRVSVAVSDRIKVFLRDQCSRAGLMRLQLQMRVCCSL